MKKWPSCLLLVLNNFSLLQILQVYFFFLILTPCFCYEIWFGIGGYVFVHTYTCECIHKWLLFVMMLGHVWLFANQWTAALQASLSINISQSLLKLMSIESVMSSYHLLLLSSIFPTITVFTNDLALHIRWPKCWSFSFSISPSKEYSGLISFRIDWFDLLKVQGTL